MGGSSGGGTGGSAGSAPALCGTNHVVATPENNYEFHSELTIEITKVKPSAELMFDWGDLTTDFLGHSVNLNDIGMVEIGLWLLDIDQFEQGLNDDTLRQDQLAIIATILPDPPGETTGSIYDLSSNGMPLSKEMIDPYLDITSYPPDEHIYTAMVANGTDLGKGTRMLHGFQLDAGSTNTNVVIKDTSTHLEMSADLHSLVQPVVPVGNPAVVIDWDAMTLTAAELPFDPQQITQLRVGKYSLSATDLELKENFLNLDTKADTLYSAVVKSGTSIELSKAKDSTGAAFAGIDDTHTWIIALNCGACSNPAPWYLTVLKPCTPP
jgi:hypothetical protein